MDSIVRKTLSLFALAAATAAFASNASAQCNAQPFGAEPTMQEQAWHGQGSTRLMPIDWHHAGDDIVGFWNVVITAEGNTGPGAPPDGAVIDAGLQQWHDDGTEFLNSSAQHPLTQNYCMGVWERIGPLTYSLNHFAYNYDAATQKVIGLTRIREVITLNFEGTKFTGTFSAEGYDLLRNKLGGVKAKVVGKRIRLDTGAQEIS